MKITFFKFKKFFYRSIYLVIFISFILGFFASFLAGIFIPNRTLIIGGSSSVYPLFTALENEFKKTGKNYQYISSGSYAGLWGVLNERKEIGFMSKDFQREKDQEVMKIINSQNFQLEQKTLAKDGIIFIYSLPKNCSFVDTTKKDLNLNLSQEEIKQIFGSPVFYWENLSPSQIKCNKKGNKIHRISRQNGSGTRSVFEQKIMNNEQVFTDNTEKSSGPILKSVTKTPGQISYISFSYIDKILQMQKDGKNIGIISLNGIFPTIETIKDDSYFLSRPFIMLYLNKNQKKLQPFFEFLRQKTTIEIIEKNKFIYVYEKN